MIELLISCKKLLVKLLEWTVMLLMAALVFDVLWGIFSREILTYSSQALHWISDNVPEWGVLSHESWEYMFKVAEKMSSPSRWTEELAKMLIIWVSLLGASVAFAAKAHLGVDYFVGKLDVNAKKLINVIVSLLVMFFAAVVMVGYGWILAMETLNKGQDSPAMKIPYGYVYLALPISGVFIVLFCLEEIVETFSPAVQAEKADKTVPQS